MASCVRGLCFLTEEGDCRAGENWASKLLAQGCVHSDLHVPHSLPVRNYNHFPSFSSSFPSAVKLRIHLSTLISSIFPISTSSFHLPHRFPPVLAYPLHSKLSFNLSLPLLILLSIFISITCSILLSSAV